MKDFQFHYLTAKIIADSGEIPYEPSFLSNVSFFYVPYSYPILYHTLIAQVHFMTGLDIFTIMLAFQLLLMIWLVLLVFTFTARFFDKSSAYWAVIVLIGMPAFAFTTFLGFITARSHATVLFFIIIFLMVWFLKERKKHLLIPLGVFILIFLPAHKQSIIILGISVIFLAFALKQETIFHMNEKILQFLKKAIVFVSVFVIAYIFCVYTPTDGFIRLLYSGMKYGALGVFGFAFAFFTLLKRKNETSKHFLYFIIITVGLISLFKWRAIDFVFPLVAVVSGCFISRHVHRLNLRPTMLVLIVCVFAITGLVGGMFYFISSGQYNEVDVGLQENIEDSIDKRYANKLFWNSNPTTSKNQLYTTFVGRYYDTALISSMGKFLDSAYFDADFNSTRDVVRYFQSGNYFNFHNDLNESSENELNRLSNNKTNYVGCEIDCLPDENKLEDLGNYQIFSIKQNSERFSEAEEIREIVGSKSILVPFKDVSTFLQADVNPINAQHMRQLLSVEFLEYKNQLFRKFRLTQGFSDSENELINRLMNESAFYNNDSKLCSQPEFIVLPQDDKNTTNELFVGEYFILIRGNDESLIPCPTIDFNSLGDLNSTIYTIITLTGADVKKPSGASKKAKSTQILLDSWEFEETVMFILLSLVILVVFFKKI